MSQPAAKEYSFWQHLEALRSMLWRMAAATFVLFPVAWYVTSPLIDLLIAYACPPEFQKLYYFSPMDAFVAELKFALVLALAGAFPYNLWALWRFIAPGLYRAERKALRLYVLAGTLLFLFGALFCVGVVLPLVMNFAAGFAREGLQPMIGLASFLSLAGYLTLAFGVLFQFPLGVILVVRAGIVRASTLRKLRPVIVVIILVLAAIASPPDVLSQLLVAAPTWVLFELGLLIAARWERPEEPAEEAKDAEQAPATTPGSFEFYQQQSIHHETKAGE